MQNKKRVFFITRLGSKGFLLLLFCFLAAGIVVFNRKESQQIVLKEGEVSLADIYAPFSFSYIDREKTRYYREESRKRVQDIYDLDPRVEEAFKAKLDNLFQALGENEEKSETNLSSAAVLSTSLTPSTVRTLSGIEKEERENIKNKLTRIFSFLLKDGIIDSEVKEELMGKSSFMINVHNPKTKSFRKRLVEQLPTVEDIDARIKEQVLFYFPENRRVRIAAEEIIKKNIAPNLVFNKQETERRKEEAWNSVPEVKKEIKKNQLIVARGQRVNSSHLSQITEINRKRSSLGMFFSFAGLPFIGSSLLVFIFIILFWRYYKDFSFSIPRFSIFCLLSFVSLLFLLLARGVIAFSLPAFFIPLSFASMLVAILLNARLAIFLTMLLSLFSGLISNSLDIGILSFVGGIVGVYAVEGVKRRAQLVKAGFLVGLANIFVMLSLSLLKLEGSWKTLIEAIRSGLFTTYLGLALTFGLWGVIKSCLCLMANGLVSAFLVLGFLPLFEHLFKLTTNISLLEISDLNHPLLKKLIMEAPGTYHHSLIVGNLAESASEAIGANSLLARVASYYHDIGKIEKSEYFSENQRGKNKHNKLTPTMSSLIIINHIKNGVEMARKYNLPRQIIDIIRQHHGTSLVPYFYQRALELGKEEVNQENFRYPGPKPQTKEAAIVMLADSLEASSRSLDEPTPSRLKALVEKVINDKFIDHQLDECNLALTDLNKISRSFAYVLNAIFHNRVKYPDANKPKN